MKKLTETEERVLNRIQKDWVVTEAPFRELSEELGIDEDALIRIIDNLKKENIIRDISAIFNASGLGYESTLIAFEIPEKDIEKAVSAINAHPGVSHNYLRDHRYNIWFTLSVSRKTSLDKEAQILAKKANAKDFLILRTEKLLKIGLMLHIGEGDDNPDSGDAMHSHENKQRNPARDLSEQEKKAVYILQIDLPLIKRPFRHLIEKLKLDIDEKMLVQLGEEFKREGIMRRYGAILKHNKAGYNFNAMTAWKLKNYDDIDIAKIFSSVPNISHLYLRTLYPGKWEHGLFAMIHAKSGEELNTIINKIRDQSGIKDYLVLNSLKEFKKMRVKYFTEAFS